LTLLDFIGGIAHDTCGVNICRNTYTGLSSWLTVSYQRRLVPPSSLIRALDWPWSSQSAWGSHPIQEGTF